MTLAEIQKLAIQAYLKVLREHPTGWTPPPTDMRDKKWSRILRDVWPECSTVYLTKANTQHSNRHKWCEEHAGNYWASGNGEAWHFERRDIAALFKLTYGGSQND